MSELINLGRIARLVGIDRQDIIALAHRAGAMYWTKPLMVGTKRRIIDMPRTELKTVQRALYDHVLSGVALAGSVYSVAGKGVIENARQHLNQPFMAVLDVADCFPSITAAMVREGLHRAGFDDVAARHITQLVTCRGRLPQGAPSSPAIMNIVLGELDAALECAASIGGCVYTRYMDDICLSGDHDLGSLVSRANTILRHNGFQANQGKTRRWGPEDRHTVTKIVVSSSLSPTQEYLDALVSELKRNGCHLSLRDRNRLKGKIGWVRALNSELGRQLDRTSGARRLVA